MAVAGGGADVALGAWGELTAGWEWHHDPRLCFMLPAAAHEPA